MKPLRSRGLELSEKLENVKSQLLSARNGRERSLSLTSLGDFLILLSWDPLTIFISRFEEHRQA